MYEKKSYERICAYCEKPYTAHDRRSMYCSKRCKDVASRLNRGIKCNDSTKPYKKTCCICGNEFETFRDSVVCCSSKCSEIYREKRDREAFQKKCAVCGKPFLTKHDSQMTCGLDECKNYYKKAQHKRRNKRLAEKNRIEKEWYKASHTVERICSECGEIFYCLDSETRVTCSEKCSKKHNRKRRDKRIPKNRRLDNISIKRLYVRDGGICYMCGCNCNWDDWRIAKSGNEYPGDTYPTIDHVIPVSIGGLDSWDNVRLACWKCNMEKSNNILEITPIPHDFAVSAKYQPPTKRTAQYTLDGELIKVWDSTAEIKRALGFNDKHIQNVCRKDKSKTGNAYGFHWEYIDEAMA